MNGPIPKSIITECDRNVKVYGGLYEDGCGGLLVELPEGYWAKLIEVEYVPAESENAGSWKLVVSGITTAKAAQAAVVELVSEG